ncbi:neuromedin-U isoform X3 [Esox lucius]|uniref:Neuromedin U C-terminal domain-containing protein n=1 Tax=Esox lucius TaxID=8010 RepID=A0A3P8XIL9_ESOLU|nr:neuromedin-U isoform X3 [Esox lucius]
MMKTSQCQNRVSQTSSASYMSSLSASAKNPLSSASLTLMVLLISAIPVCKSVPILQQRVTTDQELVISQLEDMCSSYLSKDLPFRTPNVLGEFCLLVLFQKSKDMKAHDNPTKRSSVMHPLLQLIPQLHSRRGRGEEVVVRNDLQGPGAIQTRGYFIYRPRNGRRDLELE